MTNHVAKSTHIAGMQYFKISNIITQIEFGCKVTKKIAHLQGFPVQNVRFGFIMGIFLLNHVTAHVWLESRWYADTFWGLVVL